ncbi:hypothetical protein C1645_830163 [Glomus cerebriforme]|uniref:F-box domain-containing protein n=1 Tax=Glomus cerebriforme TaxID=658196 RepID=A0A397SP73_9GLOM|nr:hypothetical protein C1645_830163 [Glomus cerebriforme]
MACSQIFSGDLPELVYEILHHIQNDISTLHSCILINRAWCRLAIPLLWKDPFSSKFPKNYSFIEIYLHNLSEESKSLLNDYGINRHLFPSNILFNYISFIKCLCTRNIRCSVERWIAAVNTSTYEPTINFKRLIYRVLLNKIIENNVKLHTLKVELNVNRYHKYFDDFYDFISENPNFIVNIRNLNLHLVVKPENVSRIYFFLKFLYSHCSSISSLSCKLYFKLSTVDNNDINLTQKPLLQLIGNQKNLKKISFMLIWVVRY